MTKSPRILVVDNYDSFTYNLVQYLAQLGAEVTVKRNDAIDAAQIADRSAYDGVMISPGPGNPDSAGICLAAVPACVSSGMPLIGVCLGHQTIVQAFGGDIIHAKKVMHGKTSAISHDGSSVFKGLANPLTVVRYHSLAADPTNLPDVLHVTAQTDDGEIMAISHKSLAICAVQFHPESISSESGHELLQNWLDTL